MKTILRILMYLSGVLSLVTLAAFYVLVFLEDHLRAHVALMFCFFSVLLVVFLNSRFLRRRLE